MPTPILPDVVAVTIEALLAQPTTATNVGARVYGRIPREPVWPLWAVSLIDGAENPDGGGLARIQIDAWGAGSSEADEFEASSHAAAIVSICRDLRGAYSTGRISSTAHLNTVPLPDPDTGRSRFAVDLEIETYSL